MTVHEGYSPRNRTERIIAIGRLFLAVFLMIAVLVDANRPGLYALLVNRLAIWYLAYSAALAILTWKTRATSKTVPVATHLVDLLVFAMVMHFSEGPTSQFFVYFVFATICGALRWHGRGALLTGAAVLAAYIVLTLAGVAYFGTPLVDKVRFVTRCTHLAVVAGMVAYLGAYQHRLQREIERLAAWPRRLPLLESDAIREVLTYAAGVLRAHRLILVWEEEDEPSLRVASLSPTQFEVGRERPDAFGTLVAEELQRSSFLCTDLSKPSCEVLYRIPAGLNLWQGVPLDAAFRERHPMRSVLGLRLSAGAIEGWLFALDRKRLSADDLLLGDIVGRLVAGALELNAVVEQLRETAAGEERLRLARELHDGVLQSLTAAALQAQRARQAVTANPAEADRRLETIEQTILAEQQALRLAIADLNPGALRHAIVNDAAERVRDAAARVAAQWDIRVDLDIQPRIPSIPHRTAHELTRMVQESLVNAVRHGAATAVHLSFAPVDHDLRLTISYDGRGFAGFRGRQDLASLKAMKAGPRTLKERVSALGGSLVIDSSETRVQVEILVPITPSAR